MMRSAQKFSIAGIKPDTDTKANARARLDTGPLCNYRCEFCYYKEHLSERDSLDTVKQRVDYIWDYGIREIDLSGGESSIEPNWFPILDYCREKGFDNISTLSHGGRFSKLDFLQKSVDHGLKEILFSLHGYNAETHEAVTGIKGSYDKILQAIDNANQLGLVVRINCTVYDVNYKGLAQYYPAIIKRIQPLEVNFIAIKYNLDNREFRNVPYRKLTDAIKDTIDCIEKDVKYINVRFTPYCYMKGYEKYVCNVYQHIYDLYDWNRAVYNQRVDTSKSYTEVEKLKQSYESAANDRMLNYYKDDNCRDCMHYYICDGIDKSLEETELYPIYGDKLLEVNHYRKGFYD